MASGTCRLISKYCSSIGVSFMGRDMVGRIVRLSVIDCPQRGTPKPEPAPRFCLLLVSEPHRTDDCLCGARISAPVTPSANRGLSLPQQGSAGGIELDHD